MRLWPALAGRRASDEDREAKDKKNLRHASPACCRLLPLSSTATTQAPPLVRDPVAESERSDEMKCRFVNGEEGRSIDLLLEPEDQNERLLLEIMIRQSGEPVFGTKSYSGSKITSVLLTFEKRQRKGAVR